MKGLVRKATLLSVLGLLVAGAAFANVPDPAQSICPDGWIHVGGTDNNVPSVPDPAFAFCIVVKDAAGNPIANSSVVIDFGECTDLSLCMDQADPDVIVDCATKTVRKKTDGTGTACFNIVGGGILQSHPCFNADPLGGVAGCVRVFADGVLLCRLNATTFDLNNVGGIGSGDLSLWVDAFLCGSEVPAADYTCSGDIGSGDLSVWVDAFLGNIFGMGLYNFSCEGTKATKCP